ncbi:MAG: putative phosphoenolpyruvate synthase [Thermoleophilia bacterium]|nr:putative phosphoenolpyruvate synthase [Thermoleophilia bacterium]
MTDATIWHPPPEGTAGIPVRALVGGKAEGLVLAAQHDLPVPPWVAVPIDAWRAAAGATPGLDPRALRAHVCAAAWWPALLTWWRDELDGAPLAVRSSAHGEDGATTGASFAGIFTSVLHVTSDDALADAIVACWRSATAPPARNYVAARNLPDDACAMAVIVQRMVAARLAGVAFSRDPATGRDVVVLSVTSGTAERLVDGAEAGLTVTADRTTGELTSAEDVSARAWRSVLREAVEHALAAEHAFGGAAADVEWAADDARTWVVQVRVARVPANPGATIDTTDTEEQFAGRARALTASTAVRFGVAATTELMRLGAGLDELPAISSDAAPITVQQQRIGIDLARWYALAERHAPTAPDLHWLRRAWGVAGGSVWSDDGPPLPTETPLVVVAAAAAAHAPLGARSAATSDAGADTEHGIGVRITQLLADADDLARQGAALDIVRPWLHARADAMGRPSDPVAGADPVLHDLRALAGAPLDDAAIAGFIERHGDLTEDGLHLELPRLREHPDRVAALVRLSGSGLHVPPADPVTDPPIGDDLDDLDDQLARMWGRREELRRARAGCFARLRVLALEAGALLHAGGTLDRIDDVFDLALPELRDLLDGTLAPQLARRIAARRQRDATRPASNVVVLAPSATPGPADLYGLPCVAGRASGRAVVATIPDAASAAHGGVLVCERLTPDSASWLGAHVAVVVERSSPLAHAVIIARELGVPTVVQVEHATGRVRPGDDLQVDGGAGTIVITR